MATGFASPALSNTPSQPINTQPPVDGNAFSTVCGSICVWCCNCCMFGPPQSWLNGTPGFTALRTWILGTFYNNTVIPEYRNWGQQLAQTIVMEARMIGGFYDAQNFLGAQLDLQRLSAEASRNYTPSEAMCQFGTLSRSLGASDEKARANQRRMSEVALNRSLGTFAGLGSTGRGQDNSDRIENFVANLCSKTDENNVLELVCNNASVTDKRLNRDIHYPRTLGVPETLRVNLTDGSLTAEESDLVMLAHNLYGSTTWIKRFSEYDFKSGTGQQLYQLVRSVTAKRALAENSFNAYVGMKAQGSGASYTYMDKVMQNLGMATGDRQAYFGAGTEPSYYAQMEVLTKRIYQDPQFYANLMDGRANVSRQMAAMEGLGLMQDRDIYTSMSRSEMLLALYVEMEARQLKSKIQNNTTNR